MAENSVWIIGIVTLLAGALIGYLLGRSGDSSSQKKLTSQLNDAQRDLNEYKEKVNGHFEKTAELVNGLTESYKQVHQHLAQGSEMLCMGEHSPEKLNSDVQARIAESASAAETSTAAEQSPITDEPATAAEPDVVEPPRDYAPKEPDEEGMLSDKYGLKKTAEFQEDDSKEEIPPLLKDQIPAAKVSDKEEK
ncbi:YhcB family protein [Amphritea sp. 1_MG-2023]|uniref:YhcB family protein n=1 Tax=Amphritea sp. 1_MG-2023 TaxID=3062670 RepID=UPI0026E220F8|nr:YhcB family protein [Amphritea sp. 1_MG-2023]MDO6564047.1 YhcB family protein [Amphritea sp. 1_MG-2023]